MKTDTVFATTKDGVTVTLYTRTEGWSFGTVGEVRLGRKVLATTDVLPYGFTGAALDAARTLARKLVVGAS